MGSSCVALDRPDAELREFDLCCDLQVSIVFPNGTGSSYHCKDPAKWAGFYPCCGKVAMVCDPHHADKHPFYCSQCKRQAKNLINWTRL